MLCFQMYKSTDHFHLSDFFVLHDLTFIYERYWNLISLAKSIKCDSMFATNSWIQSCGLWAFHITFWFSLVVFFITYLPHIQVFIWSTYFSKELFPFIFISNFGFLIEQKVYQEWVPKSKKYCLSLTPLHQQTHLSTHSLGSMVLNASYM